MIHIQGLCKSFGERVALDSITARVEEGAIVTIVGRSGSGKSTLLRALAALEPFDRGTIEIAGQVLGAGHHRVPAEFHARVGLLFQDYQLFPHLSALDNVTLAPRVVQRMSRSDAERLGRTWLERVGLGDRAAARPHELSGGQKQRVAMARALAQGPRVLLLDEPTSALDPEMRRDVQHVLRDVVRAERDAKSLTLVLVTHDLTLARALSDEIWVLENGALTERGSPAQLLPKTPSERRNAVLVDERAP